MSAALVVTDAWPGAHGKPPAPTAVQPTGFLVAAGNRDEAATINALTQDLEATLSACVPEEFRLPSHFTDLRLGRQCCMLFAYIMRILWMSTIVPEGAFQTEQSRMNTMFESLARRRHLFVGFAFAASAPNGFLAMSIRRRARAALVTMGHS